MLTSCSDTHAAGKPNCTGLATWSDGSSYETGLVSGLVVEAVNVEGGEQVAWDGDALVGEFETHSLSTLCEYTCVW